MKELTKNQEDILTYTASYCNKLEETYVRNQHPESTGKNIPTSFVIDKSGNKYYKVESRHHERDNRVHCFVDKNTGYVYKPLTATKKSKFVKYSLADAESKEYMYSMMQKHWFEYLHEKVASQHDRSWEEK